MGLLGGVERGRECDGAGLGVGCGVGGTVGASVSKFASTIAASPSTVASGSASMGLPHLAQKRAVSGTWQPQNVQNMEVGFYHSHGRTTNLCLLLAYLFDLNRSPVRQNFRHSLHDFIGVVAHGQDAVGPMSRSVLEQQFVRFLSRFFTQLR